MDRQAQSRQASHFRELHDAKRGVLLLPNAWDAASARIFADLGYDAIATTSGGVAWSLGYPDGERAPLDEILAVVRRIVRVVKLPVTVDFEGGHGESPEDVGNHVREVVEAGAVGINLEDGILHERLRDIDDASARIAAAREAAERAGVSIVINARVDTFIVGYGADEAERIAETKRRASAYLAAGADCIFPIGVSREETIRELAASIAAPINIAARAGLAPVSELGRWGVARVSTATRLAAVAFSAARDAAKGLRESGRFDGLEANFGYSEMEGLFGEA